MTVKKKKNVTGEFQLNKTGISFHGLNENMISESEVLQYFKTENFIFNDLNVINDYLMLISKSKYRRQTLQHFLAHHVISGER